MVFSIMSEDRANDTRKPPRHRPLYQNEADTRARGRPHWNGQVQPRLNANDTSIQGAPRPPHSSSYPREENTRGVTQQQNQLYVNQGKTPVVTPPPPHSQLYVNEGSIQDSTPQTISQLYVNQITTQNNRPKLQPPNSWTFVSEKGAHNSRPKLAPPNSQPFASENSSQNNRPKLLPPYASGIQGAPPPPHSSSYPRERSSRDATQQQNQLYVNKGNTPILKPPPPHSQLYVNKGSNQDSTPQASSQLYVTKYSTQNDRPKLPLPNNQRYPNEKTTQNSPPKLLQPTANSRCTDSLMLCCNVHGLHGMTSALPNPPAHNANDPKSRKPAMAESQSAPDPEVGSYTWFSGELNREEVQTKLMQRSTDGMYVVRNSSHGDHMYCLSVYYKSKVYHIKIRQEKNMFLLGEKRESEPSFPCLSDLIQHYQNHPILLKKDRSQQTVLKLALPK